MDASLFRTKKLVSRGVSEPTASDGGVVETYGTNSTRRVGIGTHLGAGGIVAQQATARFFTQVNKSLSCIHKSKFIRN
jgi:hypothetical protein